MLTPTTRPRGDRNLPSQLGRLDGTDNLLSRRIDANRNGRRATGVVRTGTTIITGQYNQTTVGSTTIVYGQDWVIDTAAGSVTADAPAVTISDTEPGHLVVADDGFYTIEWHQALSFPFNAPTLAGFTMNYWSAEVLARWTRPIAADGYLHADPGVRDVFTLVDIHMEAGEEFYPRMEWASIGQTAIDEGMLIRVTRTQ